ncbi:MAG: T9SS type A sorting domain-containing protein [Bacteroidales bacterium]|nr:T9SS type A sorting domain-containing protein [Bacteroidales bacterium]
MIIEVFAEEPQVIKINLYNVMGSKVYEYTEKIETASEFSHTIPTEYLNSGIMIIHVEANGQLYHQKISGNLK